MDYVDKLIAKNKKVRIKKGNAITEAEQEIIKEMHGTYKLSLIVDAINKIRLHKGVKSCITSTVHRAAKKLGLIKKVYKKIIHDEPDSEFVNMRKFYEDYKF